MCTRTCGAKPQGATINNIVPGAKSASVLKSSNATDSDRGRPPYVTQK